MLLEIIDKHVGEMNAEELWETTMNPENRTIIQVTIDEAQEITEQMLTICMDEDASLRKEFITENALYADIDK